jgi:alpha-beta hydrolase superfamily lysophospholipase
MQDFCYFTEKLQFPSQDLRLSIWKPALTDYKGVIAAIHGLSSHGKRSFYYFGPYMARKGWITIALDMPGYGNWESQDRTLEREHWEMGNLAISAFIKKCKKYSMNKKLILLGVSLGSVNCINYVIKNESKKDFSIDNLVCIVPTLDMHLPFYLFVFMKIMLFLNPKARINLEKFEGNIMCNDPNSIIFKDDPLVLKRSSVAYIYQAFKAIKWISKQSGYWSDGLPTLLISADLDKIAKRTYVEEFYKKLPAKTNVKHINYEKCDHYILYDNLRENMFADIDDFLTRY